MADVNGTDHLVRHEKDNVGKGYENEGFHSCDRKEEEEESSSDDDRLRIVVTENGRRVEGDAPLPNGHARDDPISHATTTVNGTAVVVLGEDDVDEKCNNIGTESDMDSAQKPLDTRLHHYVPVDDIEKKILNGSDGTHVSIPEDAVISFSTGRVRVKNRSSGSPQAQEERDSIPLETIPGSYELGDKPGIGLEKKAELEAELSNHKNGVWAETHIYSGAEDIFTSEKLNGTSKSSDEVSLPVNSHRKCLSREGSSSSSENKSTGEKLYFTDESRKLCPGWRRLILCALILIIVAVAVCLAVLAATGILLAESDSKNIRHESGHPLPSVDSISQAGFPFRKPSSNVPQKFQPSVTKEVEFLLNTTSTTTAYGGMDTVSPVPPQVSSKVPVLNDTSHSQTIVPNALVGEFTIIDENFTEDLNDNNSQGFLNLANNLEIELRRIFRENRGEFEKLQILSFRPGSIRVKFVVNWIPNHQVILSSKASEILAADLGKKNNSFFNLFHVNISTIHFIDVFDECSIQKGGCSFDCSWNYDTLVKTCICPANTYLQSDGKSCGIKEETSTVKVATTESLTTLSVTEPVLTTTTIAFTTIEDKQTVSPSPYSLDSSSMKQTPTTINSLLNETTTIEHLQTDNYTSPSQTVHQESTTETYGTIKEELATRQDTTEVNTPTTVRTTSENFFPPITTAQTSETLRDITTHIPTINNSFLNEGTTAHVRKEIFIPTSETTTPFPITKSLSTSETEQTTNVPDTNFEESTQSTTMGFDTKKAQTNADIVKPMDDYTTMNSDVTKQPTNSYTFNPIYEGTTEDKTTLKFHLIETPTELYTVSPHIEYPTEFPESSTAFSTLSKDKLYTTIATPSNTNTFINEEEITQKYDTTTKSVDVTFPMTSSERTKYPTTETEKTLREDQELTTVKPDTVYETTNNFMKETIEAHSYTTVPPVTEFVNFTTDKFMTTESPKINETFQTPQFNRTPGVLRFYDNLTHYEEHSLNITTHDYAEIGLSFNESTSTSNDDILFGDTTPTFNSQNSSTTETTKPDYIPSTDITNHNQSVTTIVADITPTIGYPGTDLITDIYIENTTEVSTYAENYTETTPYNVSDAETTLTEYSFANTAFPTIFQNDNDTTLSKTVDKDNETMVSSTIVTMRSFNTTDVSFNNEETTKSFKPETKFTGFHSELTTVIYERETTTLNTLEPTAPTMSSKTENFTTRATASSIETKLTTLITDTNETMPVTTVMHESKTGYPIEFSENTNFARNTTSYTGRTMVTTTELPETKELNLGESLTVTPLKEMSLDNTKPTTSEMHSVTPITHLENKTETSTFGNNETEPSIIDHVDVTTQRSDFNAHTHINIDKTTDNHTEGTIVTTTELPGTEEIDEKLSNKITTTSFIGTTTAAPVGVNGNHDHSHETITEGLSTLPITETYQDTNDSYTNSTEKSTENFNNTNMFENETTTISGESSTTFNENRTTIIIAEKQLTTAKVSHEDETTEMAVKMGGTKTFNEMTSTLSMDIPTIPMDTSTITMDTSTITMDTSTIPMDTSTIPMETETTVGLKGEAETTLAFLPSDRESFTTQSTIMDIGETTNYYTEVILPTASMLDNRTLTTVDNLNMTTSYYTTPVSVHGDTTNVTEILPDLKAFDTLAENATTAYAEEITSEFNNTDENSTTDFTLSSINFNISDGNNTFQEDSNFTTNGYEDVINEITTNASIGIECREDQFICQRLNICLNNTFMCDGILDCPDGTDEFDCRDSCHTNFMCINSSTCIMSEARCDGIWDCENGTDEEFCTPTECAKHEVMCSDGSKCIKPVDICDWKYDCKDRSDEVGCVERTTCESTGKFFCNDGLCIPWSLKCDGEFDCKDKEDEGNCTCLNDEFQCNDGKCLKSSSRCDGHKDCHSGDDEMGCVNVDSQHMVITFEPYSGTWAMLCAEDFNLDDGHYLCQELGFGHALKVNKLHVSFNGTWMAMKRENLTDASLWTERVSFVESCTSNLAAEVECQKFACGEYTGLLHRRKKREILSSSSSSQWPFIGYTSTIHSSRGCLSEILTPIWLITSAECLLSISKKPFNASNWYVQTNIGQKKETDVAQNHEVLRIIDHHHSSKFRSLILRDYDVALVRLKHALVFVSDKIGAICPPEEQVPPGITCFSGVLGTEKPRAPPPKILSINSLALQIIERKNCNIIDHYNNSVNQRMLCTQSSEGHTICDNDEGTPLMCLTGINKWFLAGMLTYQRYCEVYSKHPAVFSNLFAMRKFIDQVTGQKQYEIAYDSNVYVIIPPTTPSPTIPETTTVIYTSTEALSTTEFLETTTSNYTTEYETEASNYSTEFTTDMASTTLTVGELGTNATNNITESTRMTTYMPLVDEMRSDTTAENLTLEMERMKQSEDNYTTLSHLEYESTYSIAHMENITTPYIFEEEGILTSTPIADNENSTFNDHTNLSKIEIKEFQDLSMKTTTSVSEYSTSEIQMGESLLDNTTELYKLGVLTTQTIFSNLTTAEQFETSGEPVTVQDADNFTSTTVTESPLEKVLELPILNKTVIEESISTTLPSLQKDYLTTMSDINSTNTELTTLRNTENPYIVKDSYIVKESSATNVNSDMTTTEATKTETFTFEIDGEPNSDLAFDVFTSKTGIRLESPGYLEKLESTSNFKEHSSRSRNLNEPHNVSDIFYDLSTTRPSTETTINANLTDAPQSMVKSFPTETTKHLDQAQGTTQIEGKIANSHDLTETPEIISERTTIIANYVRGDEYVPLEIGKGASDIKKFAGETTISPVFKLQPIRMDKDYRKLSEERYETTSTPNFLTTASETVPMIEVTTSSPYYGNSRGTLKPSQLKEFTIGMQSTGGTKTDSYLMTDDTTLIPDYTTKEPNAAAKTTESLPKFPIIDANSQIIAKETGTIDYITTRETGQTPGIERNYTEFNKVAEEIKVPTVIAANGTTTAMDTKTHPITEGTTPIPNSSNTLGKIRHYYEKGAEFEKLVRERGESTIPDYTKIGFTEPTQNLKFGNSGGITQLTSEKMKTISALNLLIENTTASKPDVTTKIPEIKITIPEAELTTQREDTKTSSSTPEALTLKETTIAETAIGDKTQQTIEETKTTSDLRITFEDTSVTVPYLMTEIPKREHTILEDKLSTQRGPTKSTRIPEASKIITEMTASDTAMGETKYDMQPLTSSTQPVNTLKDMETTQTDTNTPIFNSADFKTTTENSLIHLLTTSSYKHLNETSGDDTTAIEFIRETTLNPTTLPDIEYDQSMPMFSNETKLLHLSSEKLIVSRVNNKIEKCGLWDHPNNTMELKKLKFYEEWPALGYLQMVSEPKLCAATVVSSQFVLTSLSCLSYRNEELNPDKWTYISGLHSSSSDIGTQVHLVSEIIPHAENETTLKFRKHNLALVRVKDNIEMSEFSQTVCLAERNDLLQHCFTAGWSRPDSGVNKEKRFYSVPVEIISQNECNSSSNYNGSLLDTQQCVSHDNTSFPTCQMDFGSPLFCLNENRWIIQGILDISGPCDTTQPAVYNSISSARDWIIEFMKN